MPRDFLAVVKILPSNAGGTGSVPGRGTKIPHASPKKPKHKKKKQKTRSNIVTNSIKTLKKKWSTSKKSLQKKKGISFLKKKGYALNYIKARIPILGMAEQVIYGVI